MKSTPLFALLLLVLVALGCNMLEPEEGTSKPSTGDSPEKVTETSQDPMESPESEDVPDIDFPSPETTPETDASDGGDRERLVNTTQTVRFQKGATGRSYKGRIAPDGKNTYILGASKGQQIAVSVSNNQPVEFTVFRPNGSSWSGTRKRFAAELPDSGKYRIVVESGGEENVEYTIRFAVTGRPEGSNSSTIESAGGLTTVVRFRRGATSATYKNAVIRGQRNRYILGASGGQVMAVRITSVENNAVFDITAPNGRSLVRGVRDWSGQLPVNGKYRIVVGGTRGNATYTIRFAVR